MPTISNIFVLLDCKSLFPFFIYASKDQYSESTSSRAVNVSGGFGLPDFGFSVKKYSSKLHNENLILKAELLPHVFSTMHCVLLKYLHWLLKQFQSRLKGQYRTRMHKQVVAMNLKQRKLVIALKPSCDTPFTRAENACLVNASSAKPRLVTMVKTQCISF